MEWKPDDIKGLRNKLSLSQRQFAERLGVKRRTEILGNRNRDIFSLPIPCKYFIIYQVFTKDRVSQKVNSK